MNKLIVSIKCTFKLYKQPDRVGDVLESGENYYLIIGIENLKITHNSIVVEYICQNLMAETVYSIGKSNPDNLTELVHIVPTSKEMFPANPKKYDYTKLGELVICNNEYYQAMEYTDIEIDYTDIKVSYLAKKIKPLSYKEAKAKRLHEKKKKLKIKLI